MKNNVLKFYIAATYFCSTFVMLAQDPGTGTDGDTLEGADAPAPIDDYVWVLALLALLFVFMKFRAIQKNRIQD